MPLQKICAVLNPHTCAAIAPMRRRPFPTSQGDLIRSARGQLTQAEFARTLGVDRSCLSRYESEALGAPTTVINHCLQALASSMAAEGDKWQLQEALAHARLTVESLEKASGSHRPPRAATATARKRGR